MRIVSVIFIIKWCFGVIWMYFFNPRSRMFLNHWLLTNKEETIKADFTFSSFFFLFLPEQHLCCLLSKFSTLSCCHLYKSASDVKSRKLSSQTKHSNINASTKIPINNLLSSSSCEIINKHSGTNTHGGEKYECLAWWEISKQ